MNFITSIKDKMTEVALSKLRDFLIEEKQNENGVKGFFCTLDKSGELKVTQVKNGDSLVLKEDMEKIKTLISKK
jgi:hypothetical protein